MAGINYSDMRGLAAPGLRATAQLRAETPTCDSGGAPCLGAREGWSHLGKILLLLFFSLYVVWPCFCSGTRLRHWLKYVSACFSTYLVYFFIRMRGYFNLNVVKPLLVVDTFDTVVLRRNLGLLLPVAFIVETGWSKFASFSQLLNAF